MSHTAAACAQNCSLSARLSQPRTLCGLRSRLARIRPVWETEMPAPASWAAIRGWVHADTPSGGAEVAVAAICSRTSGPYVSGRPLRGRSARAGMPRRAKRRRQVRTVVCVQPSSAAMRAFGQPWWASRAILARRASACGADDARVIASSLALRRAPKITTSLLAARAITPPPGNK